jgi:hypothetical protein
MREKKISNLFISNFFHSNFKYRRCAVRIRRNAWKSLFPWTGHPYETMAVNFNAVKVSDAVYCI